MYLLLHFRADSPQLQNLSLAPLNLHKARVPRASGFLLMAFSNARPHPLLCSTQLTTARLRKSTSVTREQFIGGAFCLRTHSGTGLEFRPARKRVLGPDCLLLAPQRHYGIDLRSAARGYVASQSSYGNQYDRGGTKSQRVPRSNSVEQVRQTGESSGEY